MNSPIFYIIIGVLAGILLLAFAWFKLIAPQLRNKRGTKTALGKSAQVIFEAAAIENHAKYHLNVFTVPLLAPNTYISLAAVIFNDHHVVLVPFTMPSARRWPKTVPVRDFDDYVRLAELIERKFEHQFTVSILAFASEPTPGASARIVSVSENAFTSIMKQRLTSEGKVPRLAFEEWLNKISLPQVQENGFFFRRKSKNPRKETAAEK